MDGKVRLLRYCLLFLLLGWRVLSADWSVVKAPEAKVYSSPGPDGVVLDVISSGMMVDVMKSEGGWAQVELPGTAEMGWVELRFLGKASEPDRAAAKLSGQQWLAPEEMSRVRGHLDRTGGSLAGVEQRLDSLLAALAGLEKPGYRPAKHKKTPKITQQPEAEEPMTLGQIREYSWSNRFFMGKYLKGGEDLFGLGFSRMVDDRGRAEVDFEACYALGDDSGSRDDFIDWNLGFRYSLKPATYRIYPFLSMYGGMRHHLKVFPGRDVRMLQCSPGLGITAELGRVFILGIEARAVFLFHGGERTDEGRMAFTCLYRY